MCNEMFYIYIIKYKLDSVLRLTLRRPLHDVVPASLSAFALYKAAIAGLTWSIVSLCTGPSCVI